MLASEYTSDQLSAISFERKKAGSGETRNRGRGWLLIADG